MSRRISGFLAVRSAEALAASSVDPVDRVPSVQNLLYQGVDRDHWGILDELHYAGRLSAEAEAFWRSVHDNGNDTSGLELTRDLDHAQRIMRSLADFDPHAEFLAVHAPELTPCKGEFTPEVKLVFLGYDAFVLGEWSLIRAGIFCSEVLRDWISKLNSNGLFDTADLARAFGDRYAEVADDQILEIAGDAIPLAVFKPEPPSSATV